MYNKKSKVVVKILQLNMHRGKVADSLLSQIVREQEADISIISEQYTKKSGGLWFEDDTATAAMWIPNTSKVRPKRNGNGNCFVWTQFDSITIISCYLTPSDSIGEFEKKLEEIEDKIREIEGYFIVAGDFNARAAEWGMPETNSRGTRIMEMAARTGLTVANVGNVPTFRRPGCEGTIPDVTLVTETIAHKITNWKVLEIYTGSDHQYISYYLETGDIENTAGNRSTRRWNAQKLDTTALIAEIDRRQDEVNMAGDASTIAEQVMNIIRHGCNKSMPNMRYPKGNKKAVYWWNEEITDLRRTCLRCRRKMTRARRRGMAEAETQEYKEAKKKIKRAISKSKKKLWEELRQNVNNDPWGLGYKIVMKKLGSKNPISEIEDHIMENIINVLFPTHVVRADNTDEENTTGLTPFTIQELNTAARRLQNKKAPGPDGIPAEVIKEIANKRPEMLLNMYNSCLREGVFPEIWKKQKLVLISKGKGDAESPSSYRPLCMLDTAGKLLERLIKPRLNEAIQASGGLSNRQHGFRPGRSTIGALQNVVEAFEDAQQETHFTRPVVVLATLDVKNAFNSLRWSDVLVALKNNFAVPYYLMKIIGNYLKNRELWYSTTNGSRTKRITSGAAQGSILGPDLWNASYDEILKIKMPEDTFLVGYADDIAAVIKARNTDDAQRKLRQVMLRTQAWLDQHGLQLATHKTEVLLLTRRHIPLEIEMHIGDTQILTKKVVKYLGIRLDSKLTYSAQINYATNKAAQITAQLSRLMANIGGPLPNKRRLLMEASNSILLYGCEIWAGTLTVKKREKALLTVQRRAALRITSAYRTVSAAAVLVIASTVPIDLQARERWKLWTLKTNNQVETTSIDAVKQETLAEWQSRWNTDTSGRWTARLIPNLDTWFKRQSGEVNYYLTQMLSGHGYFRKFLYKINKTATPYCIYEGEGVIDDSEHTFFTCIRWSERRRELEENIGVITVENLIDVMTANETNWRAVAKYTEYILRCKKNDLDTANC